MTLASQPTSTRRSSAFTAARIWRAASSGLVRALRSKPALASSRVGTSPSTTPSRALATMDVLMPPGWIEVALTQEPRSWSS